MRALRAAAVVLAVGVAGGLLGVAAVVALAGDGSPAKPPLVLQAEPVADSGVAESFGEGRHAVLREIKAGTYRTDGSSVRDFPLCSWKMFALGRLVASGSSTGPTSIVVEPMYEHVESRGCLEWRWQR